MHKIRITLSFLLLFFPALILTAQLKLVCTHGPLGDMHVLRWNAMTGAILNDVPTTASAGMVGSSVFDARYGKYYFRDTNGLQKTSFAPNNADLIVLQYYLQEAQIDMQYGKIYGLDSDGGMKLMELNMADSTEQLLLPIPGCIGVEVGSSAYDSNHGIFYFLGIDSSNQLCLYAITTTNANYSFVKTPMPINTLEFAALAYDNDQDLLFGLAHLRNSSGSTQNLQIHKINTATGALSLEVDLPQCRYLQDGNNTYDQAAHSLIFRAGISGMSLWSYDTQAHVLSTLVQPASTYSEIEADNSDFAYAKYGPVGSLDAATVAMGIEAFPNPTQDRLALRLPQSATSVKLSISDARGRLLMTSTMAPGNDATLDVHALPVGVYFVRALVDGQSMQTKFVVSR